ncbi:MAG: Hsp70 family protein, partial [Alphaproteobacteria bacterium]|nr:Hsp70 family protein [Alphaproteobacteria bacterium]
DFGTSNTVSAISSECGSPRLVSLESDKETLPSALFFISKEDQEEGVPPVLYGRRAIKAYLEDGYEGRFMRSPKKVLGTPTFEESTGLVGGSVSFQSIISGFLKHVKEQSESFAGHSLDQVVLGRPVNFTHDPKLNVVAEEELRSCALDAGFKDISFQLEPIAAAFAHERHITSPTLAIVADLGGGTSDFTVIELSQEYINLPDRRQHGLGTSGVRIGGTDFDYRLSMQSFMGLLGKGEKYLAPLNDTLLEMPLYLYTRISDWARTFEAYNNESVKMAQDAFRYTVTQKGKDKIARLLDVLQNRKAHQILNTVEGAKIALTNTTRTDFCLDFLLDSPSVFLTVQDFERAVAKDVQKVFRSLDECLLQAQVKYEDIGLVILTGGSTEIPIIQRGIESMFPHAQFSQGNKMDSVGLGLAIEATRRYG